MVILDGQDVLGTLVFEISLAECSVGFIVETILLLVTLIHQSK